MKKLIKMTALVLAAALTLAGTPAWAGNGMVLSDKELEGILAGDNDTNVSTNNNTLATSVLVLVADAQNHANAVGILNTVASINAQQSNAASAGSGGASVQQANVAFSAISRGATVNN